MQVIRRKSDNVAVYLFDDDAQISFDGFMISPIRAFDIKPETHEVVQNVPNPTIWLGNAFTYNNGWTVIDQPAIDAILARRLTEAKDSRRAEVNTLRDEKMISDFTYDSVVYQADDLSQARLDRARASALAAIVGGAQPGDYRWHGQAQDFFWIAKDNSLTTMDAQTTLAFGNAMVAREGMLIAAGTAIKSTIDACTTVEEVAAIDITTGWPA
jgi:hypothetical protein